MAQIADSIDGRLPAQKAVLYEVPATSQSFFIRSVVLVNTDEENAVTAELWINRGAGSRRIIPKWAIAGNRDAQQLTFIPLRAGDKIEGCASAADKVDYIIGYFMQEA